MKYLAPLILLVLCSSLHAATITGAVFNDLNKDGKWQSTESGIAGVTIALSNGSTTITDSKGQFSFLNLPAGKYTVTSPTVAGKFLTTVGAYSDTLSVTSIASGKNFGYTLSAQITTTQPTMTYYVDNNGNDSNNGSKASPWKSFHVVNNATVIYTSGQTFAAPASGFPIGMSTDAIIGGSDPNNTPIFQGEYILQYGLCNGVTLQNVTLTSIDGKGFGGNIRGTNIEFDNVNFLNLSEGLDFVGPCVNLTIRGGKQLGTVPGRCLYMLDVTNLQEFGGSYGPASTQSPYRWSSPGVRGGVVNGVVINQTGSVNPIACMALHSGSGVSFVNVTCIGGEFSFDGAGEGTTAPVPDKVSNCTITGLHTIETKVHITGIAFNNTYINLDCQNSTGECVSVDSSPHSGNTIISGSFTSPKHGVHYYALSDCSVKNCTLFAPNLTVPIIDGVTQPENDAGGNTVQVQPTIH